MTFTPSLFVTVVFHWNYSETSPKLRHLSELQGISLNISLPKDLSGCKKNSPLSRKSFQKRYEDLKQPFLLAQLLKNYKEAQYSSKPKSQRPLNDITMYNVTTHG
jgi:hypothetical protein